MGALYGQYGSYALGLAALAVVALAALALTPPVRKAVNRAPPSHSGLA